jgi:guanylate kinase
MATGKIIIITAPSGSGKTSIVRYLLNKHPDRLAFSVSAATRKPRNNEINGVDYYFMNAADFQQKIEEDAFIEWEMVYEGKYYGTLKSELQRIWQEGKTPLLDIDVKGALHVQKQFPRHAVSLFIQPPSLEELQKRLSARGTETPESLKARIDKASYEMTFSNHFDKIIVNEVLDKACTEAEELVMSFIEN